MLTVTDFGQSSLNALTSSPTAPATLSGALIPLLQAKSLDGVNFDFEGEGSGDQAGLTNLITSVSGSLRAADPHWQITMDTYASSAGDPSGFYNIPALAPAVDAFFVMDYELNLAGTASAASPLTSGMFSSQTTLAQYTAAVPASKVILGTPFFGIDWPTNNGTMGATATGGAADIPDSQAAGQRARVLGSGHRHGVDELPGGRPVARVVLRGRERPLRRVAAGDPRRRPRRRHLGARHGEQRRADDRGARRDLAGRAPGHRPAGDLPELPGGGRARAGRAGTRSAAPPPAGPAPSAATPAPGVRRRARLRHRDAADRPSAGPAPTTTTTAPFITGLYNGAPST